MKRIGIILVGVIFIVSGALCWAKDDYPNKPVEIIIPYPPGGGTDLSARVIAEKMKESLGQPVVVITKPGGGGAVGAVFAANSKPDGYTILAHTCGMVTRPLYEPSVAYRYTQFRPIGILSRFEHVVSVSKDLPVKNLAELVTHIKKNPRSLSYSISGKGGVSYLAMEYLKLKSKITDVDFQCIPQLGDLDAILALIGNRVQVAATTTEKALPHIKSKAIQPIAVISENRDPLLPEVPTSVEQGFPDVLASCYYVWLAPVKTPDSIVNKLEAAMEKTLQDKGVQERLTKIEIPAIYMNSGKTQAFMDNENKRWAKVIREANLGVK